MVSTILHEAIIYLKYQRALLDDAIPGIERIIEVVHKLDNPDALRASCRVRDQLLAEKRKLGEDFS